MAAVGIPLEKNRWRVPPDNTVQIIDPKNKKVKELYANSNAPQRNWKGIIIALLIIVCVSLMVVAAVIIMSLYDSGPRIKGRRLTQQIFSSGALSPIPWNGSLVGSSNKLLMVNPSGGLSVLDLLSGHSAQVMTNRTMRQIPVLEYSASSDLNYVLLRHHPKPEQANRGVPIEFRGSEYSIFSVKEERFYSLLNGKILQYATWNTVGSGIFVVMENDIHWVKANLGMSSAESIRITSTGKINAVYNGIPDYLYSKQILLSTEHTLRPSPDGKRMVFMSFDDTDVSETFYILYGETPPGASVGQIPRLHSIRLPLAGETNPKVTVNVMPLTALEDPSHGGPSLAIPLQFPEELDKDSYVTFVEWKNGTELLVQTLDRSQRLTTYLSCSGLDGKCKEVATRRTSAPGMPPVGERKTASLGEDFFAIAPVLDGDEGAFNHIVRRSSTRKTTPITFGKMEVQEILLVDSQHAYFLATTAKKPEEQHLYRVKNVRFFDEVECVSCRHSDVVNCTFVSATLAEGTEYYIKHCLGPVAPYSGLWKRNGTRPVQILHENKELVNLLSESAMPTIRRLKIPLGTQGWDASVEMAFPPIYKKEEGVKYPTVFFVKEDPTERTVTTKFHFDLLKFLSATRDVLTVTIDARGTTGRGRTFQNSLYNQLGTIDVDDVINAAKYLSTLMNAIDVDNMVIFGFGYGGYVATMALARPDSPFLGGAAVAPISTFSLHNSAFAERYFGSPSASKGNQRQYLTTEAMLQVEGLKGKPFLLLHGSADETVPLRHSMLLSAALTEKAVPFRQVVYPDQVHDLKGVQAHAVDLLAEFFDECFEEWSAKRDDLKDN